MSNVTLKDIAQIVGVSQNTVSLVLRGKKGVKDKTREDILRIAQELGYPQKGMESAFLGNVGIILALGSAANIYFHSQVLDELEVVMRKRGYNIVLINKTDSSTPDSIRSMITMSNIKGIAILGDVDEWITDVVIESRLPFIATGFFSINRMFDCILEDNIAGSLIVMRHLDMLGYRDIAFIGSVRTMSSFYERYMVYHSYINLNKYMKQDTLSWIDFTFEQLTDYSFIKVLIQDCKKLPEAFFCGNDKIATVLLKALHDCGFKVPEDVGIIGFDNNELAQLSNPTLTSVDTYYALQAQKTAAELIRKIEMNENKSTIGRILTKVKLVEGASLRRLLD